MGRLVLLRGEPAAALSLSVRSSTRASRRRRAFWRPDRSPGGWRRSTPRRLPRRFSPPPPAGEEEEEEEGEEEEEALEGGRGSPLLPPLPPPSPLCSLLHLPRSGPGAWKGRRCGPRRWSGCGGDSEVGGESERKCKKEKKTESNDFILKIEGESFAFSPLLSLS